MKLRNGWLGLALFAIILISGACDDISANPAARQASFQALTMADRPNVAVQGETSASGEDACPIDLAAIRLAIRQKGARWSVKNNALLGRSCAELSQLAAAPVPSAGASDTYYSPAKTPARLPDSFDWRNHEGNFITGIRNQGGCGSCWAFAAVAAAEANLAIVFNRTNPTFDFAEQHVLSCSGAGTCAGGPINLTLDYLRDYGVPLESCYPYLGFDAPCDNTCEEWEKEAVRVASWDWVTTTNNQDIELMKTALLEGPITSWFEVYQDFYAYEIGVYEHVWGDYVGGHFVLVVGWDDKDGAWIAKNSWGDWGDEGYFEIKWGEVSFGSWTTKVDMDHCKGLDCDDGNPCTIDSCDPLTGCLNDVAPATTVCREAADPCDQPEYCPGTTPTCPPDQRAADGDACDDGFFCNGGDTCQADECAVHAGSPCEGDQTCDEDADQCLGGDDDDDDDDDNDNDDNDDNDTDDDAADDTGDDSGAADDDASPAGGAADDDDAESGHGCG
ncbi:MAG: hypothetical protein GX444_13550 [Myxococcales bacterium]|nr:hypothetical protein [Myxococcales bacterium]